MATHFSILARESHEQRSLAGYSPWRFTELDMTEHTHAHAFKKKIVHGLEGTMPHMQWSIITEGFGAGVSFIEC